MKDYLGWLIFVAFLLGMIPGIFLGEFVTEKRYEEYIKVSNTYIVKKGFGYWSPEKKLILNKKYYIYYGFEKLEEQNDNNR